MPQPSDGATQGATDSVATATGPVPPAPETPAKAGRERPAWVMAVVPAVLVTLVVGLFASAFVWPFAQMRPKNIEIAAAGPAEQLAQIEAQLAAQQDDLFEFVLLEDRDSVVNALETRETSAGVYVGSEGVEFYTASAGNAQIAQVVSQLAAGMQAGISAQLNEATAAATEAAVLQGATGEEILALQQQAAAQASTMKVSVTDLVGGGNAFAGNLAMMPVLIGGMMGGVLTTLLVKRPALRFITLPLLSIGGGLIGSAVLGSWFGMLPGNYWVRALALGVAMLAISSFISGVGSVLGKVGLGLGAAFIMLIGTPWGGIMAPTEFLSSGLAQFGALMPSGTLVNLVKSIGYFPEASTATLWITLGLWAALGLLLLVFGELIHRGRNGKTAPELADPAVA